MWFAAFTPVHDGGSSLRAGTQTRHHYQAHVHIRLEAGVCQNPVFITVPITAGAHRPNSHISTIRLPPMFEVRTLLELRSVHSVHLSL